MMLRRLLALLALPALGAALPKPTVAYELAPVVQDGAITALGVTIRLAGDASGTTVIDWPESWAGEDQLGQWARDITVDGAQSVAPAPHGGRIVHAAPGAPLTIHYRIVSAYAGDPTVDTHQQARPAVRPTWFYAVGEALFATPEGRGDAPASFRWTGPADIGLASDLEHAAAHSGARTKTVDDIVESIVLGGRDLRIVRSGAAGAPLRIATVGRYAFDTAAFDRRAQQTVATERSFWHARDKQPFLITMAPLAPVTGRISYGGTGRSDAFALWMDGAADMSGIAWLLAHEYFHTWNYRQLGALDSHGPEAESYWLSEGFTDFYARRLMLRAGLMTPEAFAANWNEALAAYGASPYRTTGNAKAAVDFWKNREAEKLPYQRGAMLAALWDARQRAAGRPGLDAILRDQQRRVVKITPQPALTDAFAAAAARNGLVIAPDVARYLTAGEAVALPADTFGRCASVETVTRPVFARGYENQTDAAGHTIVAKLDPSSNAYTAGLRDGMTVVKRAAGEFGNSAVDYRLIVRDGSGERTITFRPAGHTDETVQQIVLDRAKFAAEPRACAAALAG